MRIRLYPAQYDFVVFKGRFAAFIGGVGSGKTFAGAVKALRAALTLEGLGMVVAPTYPMLRDATLRTFLTIAAEAQPQFYKTEMRVQLVNGAEILFRSADEPDRLRGVNLNWAWIDEAALCPVGTWDVVIGRLRGDSTAGPCWVTTTPKGRNWLYERQTEMAVFRATTFDNPFLNRDFVASLQSAYSGNSAFARQELYGEFVSFEGLVYEEFDRGVHIWQGAWPAFKQVIAGVDEGYVNPAVILVIGLDGDGRAYVVEEFYRRRVLQADVVAEARRLAEVWHVEAFYVDPSAAGLIAEMQSMGLNALPGRNEVMPGIQGIKSRLLIQGDGRPRLFFSPGCVNLMAEMESYTWREGRQGRRDEPEKVNDHGPDALRYALASLEATGGRLLLWGADDF